MHSEAAQPLVTVFGPDPLLSVTIEPADGGDEIHLHAAGQGVWVARMAAELGARPVLCSFLGGETGAGLSQLLATAPFDLRLTPTAGSVGSYVVDRRSGQRQVLASTARPGPQRHELDDLVTATVVAARTSSALVLCNPFPADGRLNDAYEVIGADVKSAGVPLLVDLSSPRLERTLAHGPDLVKLNDWELAEYVRGPVDGPRLLKAARRLQAAGAQNVVVTRAAEPILVLARDEEPYEIVPPVLPQGHREGCGDAMMGAIAAALARGLPLRSGLVLGAAAGSVNFLRRGLGTGRREVVEELAEQIRVRPWAPPRVRAKTAA